MSIIKMIRNGGQVVEDVSGIKDEIGALLKENRFLRTMVEEQVAANSVVMEKLTDLQISIDEMRDEVRYGNKTSDEIKNTKFYGQRSEILDSARDAVRNMSGTDIRKAIHRAANVHSKSRKKGYTYVYEKLRDITGFNVFDIGKITLKKSDNIDGWKKDASYINAILKHGYGKEAAIVCKQIIADK